LGNVFCSFYTWLLIVFISFDVKEFKVLLCKICTLKIYVQKLAVKYLILCIDINTTLFLFYNKIYYEGVLEKN